MNGFDVTTANGPRGLRVGLVAVGAALLLLALGAAFPAMALAKEYNVAGTVDCGLRSGQLCTIDQSVTLWTSDISGVNERWVIDVSWVKRELTGLHQDEAIDFEVWDQPEAVGGIRAVRIAGEGSFVNRHNWGVREEYTTCNDSIRAGVGKARDDDEAMAKAGIKRCKDLRR